MRFLLAPQDALSDSISQFSRASSEVYLAGKSQTVGFGRLLRQWRQTRGMNQLALATDAEISIRHLSFLETGRARPSRAMVERLGAVLDIPLAERNLLLLSAGYAPLYGARDLDAPDLEPVRRALQFILRQQEPYPALVIDALWNVVMRNAAAERIFRSFRGPTKLNREHAGNALHSTFHPDGLRRFIVNWEEFAGSLMQSIHRDAATSAAAAGLRDELLAYPGVPSRWRMPELRAGAPPLLTMRLQKDDLALAFFTTMTTLANPQDLTLAQLRIECFHPADTLTEKVAARLAAAERRAEASDPSQSASGGVSVSRASANPSAVRRTSSSRSARHVKRGSVV
jgi:transcriptional regulator with XRE-family HTH domain